MDKRSVSGHAVVVGAGVMGAQIAAHLANAGWNATLLDIVPSGAGEDKKARNAMTQRGLERAQKARPAAFFLPEYAGRIRLGNVEDDLGAVRNADWVIEAVVEKADVKKRIHDAIAANVGPETVVTTNTSGLSIAEMSEGLSDSYRGRFFGSHFFNPPRYMKLLELIPTARTTPEALTRFQAFSEAILGKRVVIAKDTPGFIANRLGVYSGQVVLHATLQRGLTVEQVDALTGPLVGHPRSATFRLHDICGLDITADVATNLKERLPADRRTSVLELPPVLQRLLADGRIGEKAGAGFYRREADRSISALDWETLDYRPRKSVSFPSTEGVKNLPLPERLRALLALNDEAGQFLWETTRDILCYAAEIAAEIADDITAIDNAIKWGFNHELGPFETWDALGVKDVAARLEKEGQPVPPLVTQLLHSGKTSFYSRENGKTFYAVLDSPHGPITQSPNYPITQHPLPDTPEFIVLRDLKAQNKVIKDTPDATLIDLGDGVNCLEFHTKMNVLGPGIIQMMNWSRDYTEKNGVALVIGNQGDHFSAGYNIQLFLMNVQEMEPDEMLANSGALQNAVMGFKRAKIPVVTACQGYALGGGCEVMLHSAVAQAAAESYIGLPETGIGVIPGGGGTKEMLLRAMAQVPPEVDPYPFLHKVWETLGMAKVATCADEARTFGFLRPSDGITMGTDRVLYEAKQRALALAASSYHPAQPAQVMVLGEAGIARFDMELHVMLQAGFISEHDRLIGHELATILCGGNLVHPQLVSEEYLLGLEREAFVRLCTTPKTLARIQHTLETGKPLRN